MAIHTEGSCSSPSVRRPEGVALLDEAMTSVVAGELAPFFTGIVYCNVIGACLELADVRRADEWSEAARAWCETLPTESPFPGMCRINRAEVARLRGAWSEAESRGDAGIGGADELRSDGAAQAIYETGEIRRRMGNLAGAEECFGRAREIGWTRSLGWPSSASRTATRRGRSGRSCRPRPRSAKAGSSARDSSPPSWTWRIAVPDLDAAAGAADSPVELAAGSTALILQAMAATAAGGVRLARGDAPAAVDSLRRAGAMWRELRLPYEAARARVPIRPRAPRGRRRG